jgi:hypothetical protein
VHDADADINQFHDIMTRVLGLEQEQPYIDTPHARLIFARAYRIKGELLWCSPQSPFVYCGYYDRAVTQSQLAVDYWANGSEVAWYQMARYDLFTSLQMCIRYGTDDERMAMIDRALAELRWLLGSQDNPYRNDTLAGAKKLWRWLHRTNNSQASVLSNILLDHGVDTANLSDICTPKPTAETRTTKLRQLRTRLKPEDDLFDA